MAPAQCRNLRGGTWTRGRQLAKSQGDCGGSGSWSSSGAAFHDTCWGSGIRGSSVLGFSPYPSG